MLALDITGIALGFGTAVSQSVSYLCSRQLVSHRGWSLRKMIVLAHVIMGVFSAVLLPFVWHSDIPPIAKWWLPFVGANGFYLLGQGAMLYALKYAEGSRIAPLMGLKVAMLAVVYTLVMRQHQNGMQWAGVGLATAAAVILNIPGQDGGPMRTRAIVAVLISCLGYCGSDLSVKALNDGLISPTAAPLGPAMLGSCLSYLVCGIGALFFLPTCGDRDPKAWKAATPYALAWFLGSLCIYGSIALAGVVLATILQSTRGLISVVLGAMLAKMGWEHLESKVSRGVLIRRLIGAALMTGAVALYVVGKTK